MTTYPMYDPTSLFAGGSDVIARAVTVSGSASYKRGTLLGRQKVGTVSSAAKSGGNTGTGTLTLDATTPRLINAQSGVYTVRMTAATTFRVTDPKGNVLGDGVAAVAFADQLKFTIAAGGTAFVAGDGFDVTIAEADKYIPCVKTAIDGAQDPVAVLAEDTDASAGDVAAPAYFHGEFVGEVMTIDASWTLTEVRAALRKLGLQLYVRSAGSLG
jgi:hypothetical protein